MRHNRLRTATILLAATLVSAAGCSGDEGARTSASDPIDVGAPTATNGTGLPIVGDAGASAETENETAEPTTIDTSEPTPTPTPTTEATPPTPTAPTEPAATLSTSVLDDGTEQAAIRTLRDATASSDGSALIVVGDVAATPGAPEGGFVETRNFVTDDRATTALSAGDGFESSAAAATPDGEGLLVVGSTTRTDGSSAAALWTADAVGSAFGEPEALLDVDSRAVDVVAWEGGVSIASIVDMGGAFGVIVSTRVDDGPWQHTSIDVPGVRPSVGGLVRFGERMVLTTGSIVSGVEVPMSWTSDDAGVSFVGHADAVLAESNRVGAPSIIDGEIWAVTTQLGNLPARLVRSSDGASWQALALEVERDDNTITLVDDVPGDVVGFEGGIAFGTYDVLGAIAFVDRSGRGTAHLAPFSRSSLFDVPVPVIVDGRLWAVADSHTSWSAAVGNAESERFTLGHSPWPAASGRVPSSVGLNVLRTGVAATAFTFPVVEDTLGGGISWRPEQSWLMVSDEGTWELPQPGEIPRDAELVASDGDLDIATVSTDNDPGDDGAEGPRGGTRVYFRRAGGNWLLEDGLLLSGPGSEDANGIAPTGSGFLLVGDSTNRTLDGQVTARPILKEYVNGEWVDLQIGNDLGPNAVLGSIARSDTGARVATGVYVVDGRRLPMVLAPDRDGVWTLVDLPGASPDLSVVDLVGATASIELIARDGLAWVLYSSTDGRTFETTPIDLGDHPATVETAAEIDGQTVLIGTIDRVGVRTLAVWHIADGLARLVELPDAPFGHDLRVTDAVLDVDGDLLIGAVLRHQSLVIEVSAETI